jgi:hypothetical protein
MKTLLKFTLVFLLFFVAIHTTSAQRFVKKKMPVGVKTYTFFDETSKFDMEFKDFNGAFDKYNLYQLDSVQKLQETPIVFDRKLTIWRLPLTRNEAMGLADKDGDEPLARLFIPLGIISPAIREKIE